MEFNVERGVFLDGIQKTLGIVERKTTNPILNNVLIKTGGEKITVIATDREIGLVADYRAEVVGEGEITVAARKLYEMIREIQGDTVNFKKLDNNWVNISCGKALYKIPGLAVDEFPEVVDDEDVGFFHVPCSVMREMINKTFFAVSTDEMRASLNGVYFAVQEGVLLMVATDGHRLSIARQAEVEEIFDTPGIIIPRKGVGEIRKLVDDGSESVEIGVKQGAFIVKRDGTVLRVSLIDADYPDYEKVMPQEEGIDILLDKNQILHSLRRMSVISNERFSGVKIRVISNKMILSSINPDVGEAQDEIDISYGGKELEMGYNVKYLIDAIDAVSENEITLEMRDAYGPGVVRTVGKDDYMCIIMPLRL